MIALPRESYAHGLVTPRELAGLFKDKQDHGNRGSLWTAVGGGGQGGIFQENYSSLTLLNPAEKTASLTCNIALASAHTLRGTVLGPAR